MNRPQVLREPEVIPDVGLERAPRNPRFVGRAVGLDLVRLPRYQLRCLLQILGREIEPARRDVAMPAMTVQPRVAGMLHDPLRERVDRFGEPAQIRESPAEPDRVVDARRIALVVGLRPGEVGFELVRRRLRRDRAGHGQQQK